MPTAANISVRETLELLDGPFSELSRGVAQGQYAFWLGSGISRERVDDLKLVIKKVLVYLQTHADPANSNCRFRQALEETLELAQLSTGERAGIDPSLAVDTWPSLEIVIQRLSNEYSRVLDIRVAGESPDFLLWDAVDVPHTFALPAEPDCEHLCLGVLAIEGVVPDIPSANWDGLIETALLQLTDGAGDILQVCIRPEDLREPRRRTRLVKFHGCAVRAAADPVVYRGLIIASCSQITAWPHDISHGPIKDLLVNLAVTTPTLMIGLSAQDTDIQQVFAEAMARMQWPWPAHPPAHVFAENALGTNQRNILRFVYRTAYDTNGVAVETSALLRAFAKPLLVALVLYVAASKLITLASLADSPGIDAAGRSRIGEGITFFRNRVAAAGDLNRLKFIRSLIGWMSRGLSLFRQGLSPVAGSLGYRAICAAPQHQIAADPTIETSGLREMAVAIGLLGLGEQQKFWRVDPGAATDGRDGVVVVGAFARLARMYFTANSEAELTLEREGIVHEDDGDAVIVHSSAPVNRQRRSPRLAPGRTGKLSPRHVDMRDLLRGSNGLAELQRRFREEAVI